MSVWLVTSRQAWNKRRRKQPRTHGARAGWQSNQITLDCLQDVLVDTEAWADAHAQFSPSGFRDSVDRGSAQVSNLPGDEFQSCALLPHFGPPAEDYFWFVDLSLAFFCLSYSSIAAPMCVEVYIAFMHHIVTLPPGCRDVERRHSRIDESFLLTSMQCLCGVLSSSRPSLQASCQWLACE